MRLFGIIFAALLCAGLIFGVALFGVSKYRRWEDDRDKQYNFVLQASDAATRVLEDANHNSLEELSYALRSSNQILSQRRDVASALIYTLQHKPFFIPLTQREKEVLTLAKEIVGGSNSKQVTEQPKTNSKSELDLTASKPLRSKVSIVRSMRVQIPQGEVIIAAPASVPLVAVRGDTATVKYMGYDVTVPVIATDLSDR